MVFVTTLPSPPEQRLSWTWAGRYPDE
ncbi:hypothetical protein HYQ46_013459 [Verticillium longisporum]|nr:hypothetical protein HYQ46_013459 [Verticillium longisporum]